MSKLVLCFVFSQKSKPISKRTTKIEIITFSIAVLDCVSDNTKRLRLCLFVWGYMVGSEFTPFFGFPDAYHTKIVKAIFTLYDRLAFYGQSNISDISFDN